MNFEPGVTPCTASFSPLQQDLAFEFGVDIINHLQSPSTKFELIALRYSGSREIDNGVTPATELPRLPYLAHAQTVCTRPYFFHPRAKRAKNRDWGLGSDKLFQNFHPLFYSQILTPSPYYSTEGTYYSQRFSQEARQLIVQQCH